MIPAIGITASAGGGPEEYYVWVGGVPVTSDNKDNITGAGIIGTVSYDPATKALTLNGAEMTENYASSSTTAAIYSEGELNIVLQGNNTAVGSRDTSINGHGVYVVSAV